MDSSDNKEVPPDILAHLYRTNYGEQKSWSNGKMRFEMLPEGYIALNRELSTGLHPQLIAVLNEDAADEIDTKLAKICVYVGIALDGVYTLAERDKLCYVLAGRLEAMRELPTAQNIILS